MKSIVALVNLLFLLSVSYTQTTVVDVIVNSEDHTTLETAVTAAGLADDLSGEGPFTVFAPTDAAFSALPAGTVEALLQDPTGDLTDILLYHVLDGEVLSTDLSDGMTAMTLNGKDIQVRISNDSVFINNALVTMADVQADNGVVHVIDAVLLPPRITVVDIIVGSEDHTTLEAAVIAAELADELSGEGPFTVFAPTDAAFAALPAGTVEALLQDPTGDLAEILLYHVVGGEVLSTDLSDGMTAMTLNGKEIRIRISNDSVFINNALVTTADIQADNGVVHVIDAVLLPPTTVWDVIVDSEDHTTLETAVLAAGLETALNGSDTLTVFAPTDAAFAALPTGAVEALLQDPTGDLAEILLYHVVGGEVLSTDLMDGMTAMTLNGKDIQVRISNDSVFINNALVTTADIQTDNGVVHVIDAVLLPPTTVWDVIVDSEDHTTLEAAVLAAGLETALNGSDTLTVFAPTDAAFAALPAGTVEALLQDPTGDLTDILLYHVLSGEVLSTDLMDGMTAMTLNGKDIRVRISNDSVFINNALVTTADIQTDNGVVHVIDAVLLPPTTVWDVIVDSEDHTVLEAAVLAAGLETALNGSDTLSVFAPTDAAFAALPAGTVEGLLDDPEGNLSTVLLYHVLAGEALSSSLSDGQMATTLQGEDLLITIRNDSVFINNALVTMADIETDNGVVHVIDAVLLPPSITSTRSVDYQLVDIKVYPNPASDRLLIDWKGNDLSQGVVRMISPQGQLLKSWIETFNNQEFYVGDMAAGVYFLEIVTDDKRALKRIVIK